jgi:hypothetical protein
VSEHGLICMGRDVIFVLHGGREISARRKRDGMLYDESGYYWPKCSLLVAPFDQGHDPVDVTKARWFFGKNFDTLQGQAPLPPRTISAWKKLGELEQIFYDRAGKYKGPFEHRFNSHRSLTQLVIGVLNRGAAKSPAILYAHGDCYRVEFPRGCVIDDRGIVLP